MSKQDQQTALADFNWDSDDFFTAPTTETKEEVVVKEEPKKEVQEENVEEVVEEVEETTEEKEETSEDDFSFGVFDDEKEQVVEEKDPLKSYVEKLKESGHLSVEIEEDDDPTDIFDKEVEARLEEAMSDFADTFDDEAKAFINFKKEGGNTRDFFRMYQQISEVPSPIVGDDNSHEKFLKYYYAAYEQMDQEEIQDRLDYLKERGKLENYSMKFHGKVEAQQQEEKEKMVEQQKQLAIQQEQRRQALSSDLKEVIDTSEEIKGFPITPKDKKSLHKYMTKAVKKVGPNQYLTKLQSDLQEAFKDKQKLVLIAKLLQNDFDISYLKNKAITEETKKQKEKLSNSKVKKRSSGTSKNSKGLADFF